MWFSYYRKINFPCQIIFRTTNSGLLLLLLQWTVVFSLRNIFPAHASNHISHHKLWVVVAVVAVKCRLFSAEYIPCACFKSYFAPQTLGCGCCSCCSEMSSFLCGIYSLRMRQIVFRTTNSGLLLLLLLQWNVVFSLRNVIPDSLPMRQIIFRATNSGLLLLQCNLVFSLRNISLRMRQIIFCATTLGCCCYCSEVSSLL